VSGLVPQLAGATEDAAATPQTDMLEAERAFQSARRLLADNRHDEACDQFARSQALYSSAVTLLNLGNCFESGGSSGGLLEAVRSFEQALVEADTISDPGLREPLRGEAQRRLAGVRERVPHLILRRSPTATARVVLDGSTLERFGSALPMNPGPHLLELSAPGKVSQVRPFVLSERRELEIALPELADAPIPAAGPRAIDAQPVPTASRRFGDLPFWLGGASLALGASWLFTGLSSRSSDAEFTRLHDSCAPGCDDATRTRMAEAKEKARDYARVTDYAVIPAFAATLGSGLVLWSLDGFATSELPSRSSASDAPRTLGAECSHDGCRWTYAGSF
jgi:hypothetical protein